MRSRLSFVLGLVPLVAYAYACSSDPEATPPLDDDSGVPDRDSGGDDGNTGEDTGTDSGNDSGTACVGNPLTADGGPGEAGVAQVMFPDNAGAFYDGPQWIPVGAGNLVFSEFNNDLLQIVAPDGGTPQTIRAVGGGIGNAFKDGVILTTSGSLSNVFRTFPDGGAAGAELPAAPAASPNDLVVGPAGNVYFTDPRYQAGAPTPTGLYRMDPANAVTLIKNFTAARVNGIAYFGPTLTLYVGTTTPKAVVKYTVAIDGSVAAATEAPFLATGAIADEPDGLAVDVGGNVYVAEAAPGGGTSGRVEVFTPGGQKLGEIPFLAHRPTGVAFGGSDGTTLYITTEKAVFKYKNRCSGAP